MWCPRCGERALVPAGNVAESLEVVERLGYKKHRAATALASGRTNLIAVVIDNDPPHPV